jgi:ADP-ribose diphosphatase
MRDDAVDVTIAGTERLCTAFHSLDRLHVGYRLGDVTMPVHPRDVLRVGGVIAVLAVDLDRDIVVLIRQFRVAAHLATGRGEMVEVVAGHVENGEDEVTAARRECQEEIGVAPNRLVPLFRFMPAPGSSDELATLFLGVVDSAVVAARAGAAAEYEDTRPIRVAIDDALAALAAGTFVNAFAITALQWLALNRERLADIVQAAAPAP